MPSTSIQEKLSRRESRLSERIIEKILLAAGISSILIIGLIFIFLFKEAIWFFATASRMELIGKTVYDAWDEKFIFNMLWQPVTWEEPKYSLIPLICGSFLVSFPATLIAALFGIGCAIYL